MRETPVALAPMVAQPEAHPNKPAQPSGLLRIFGGGLLTFGGTIVLGGSLLSWWALQEHPAASSYTTNQGADHFAWKLVQPNASLVYFSIAAISGAIMIATGTFVAFKRYGLRGLMLAVFLVGLAGAIPFMRQQPVSVVTMEARCENGFSDTQFEALRAALQPESAMATLPEGLLKKLELKSGQGIVNFSLVRLAEGLGSAAGVECELHLVDGLDAWKRDLLATFYDEHFRLELARVLERPNVFGGGLVVDKTRPWAQWRDEWLKSRPTPPSNPSTP